MTDLSAIASLVVGPVQFDSPVWLTLIPVLGVASWWIGRRSLAGLGGATRWTALVVRLLVIALLAVSLAEPSTRRVSDSVAVIAVVDASRSIPADVQLAVDRYMSELVTARKGPEDKLGGVTAAREAYIQTIPSVSTGTLERSFVGSRDGTNLADAVELGLAIAADDAANRILLVSDGNETAGSLLRAAEAARAVGIPIDVLPIEYEYTEKGEVIVENLLTPATVRAGETVTVRIQMRATRPVTGRVALRESGTPIDLDPESEGTGMRVRLRPGVNSFAVQVKPVRAGPQQYEATFTPEGVIGADGSVTTDLGDSIPENNQAGSIVFVGSEGSVLLVTESADEVAYLQRAMARSGIAVETISASAFPATLAELNAYECVILANEPAYNLSDSQQDFLRQYVHDSGGGLVVVGGPDSFGAGGWIGSPLADALPIRLDPPQKRQMPRGALVLVMHSIEMPRGVFYGKQVSRAAVDNLSRLDLVGIIEYSGVGGTDWVLPISPVGDRQRAYRAINQLTFGDMPSFDPSLNRTLADLSQADAGQKHAIIISDGDPSYSPSILQKFKDAGITISCVGVFPHSTRDFATLRTIARVTGGNMYEVDTNAALATLPNIFIKEAQTIRRSLIWEGQPFSPTVVGVAAEPMRGISAVPPITGYVVASDREGLSLVTMRGKENDPIGAVWQHGLGKVVTYTSDATTRWGRAWVSWEGYEQFWEQHVRWAMRPGGSASLRIATQNRGDDTLVVIEAFTPEGERLNFAEFRARVATPDGQGADVKVRQVGPGRYEGVLDTSDPGSYVFSVRYRGADEEGAPLEGSAQAAVVRPFADEFRALSSNRALLRQVAEITGGKELSRDPEADDPWRREGLDKPVALRSIWFELAVAGIAVFLLDVAVRRVRLEPMAVVAGVRRAFGAGPKATSTQTDTLQAARAKARQRMSPSADARKQASRKYEASGPDTGVPTISVTDERPEDKPIVKPEKPKADAKEDKGDSLSALRRAKRRAQEEFGGDD